MGFFVQTSLRVSRWWQQSIKSREHFSKWGSYVTRGPCPWGQASVWGCFTCGHLAPFRPKWVGPQICLMGKSSSLLTEFGGEAVSLELISCTCRRAWHLQPTVLGSHQSKRVQSREGWSPCCQWTLTPAGLQLACHTLVSLTSQHWCSDPCNQIYPSSHFFYWLHFSHL